MDRRHPPQPVGAARALSQPFVHLNPTRWSVRSQLLSLVLLCLLPALGLAARFPLDLAAKALGVLAGRAAPVSE